MTQLQWDAVGERKFETGLDHGVLYLPDNTGVYATGVAWNGLTAVTESPSGAEANDQYADNILYVSLRSAEKFGATLEAFTYPDEFMECDGTAVPQPGVFVGQQGRRTFGLAYRTRVGNDILGDRAGVKIHLVWGATANPSERANATVNDSPEALTLSWELSTSPLAVDGFDPVASMVIDSTVADADAFADLLEILYGAVGVDPRLPDPAEVIALFAGSVTAVDLGTPANQPTYNSGTHVVTLPSVTGIQWKINGVNKTAGVQPALTVGQTANILAVAQSGYRVTGDEDWVFNY